ncbi:MAG: RHS repeat-associated core domain-containing protein [Opitutales bacterium]|nr:RHS repeat-associated core domain-containing protein [Opitutales bacterium]
MSFHYKCMDLIGLILSEGAIAGVTSRPYNGETTFLVYDEWSLIAEYDASGQLKARYVHGLRIDEVILTVNDHGTFFHHHDALGSVTQLTDVNGVVVESYQYDVYGNVTIFDGSDDFLETSAINNRFLFTGREYLPELGLYDYRNRIYSADLGRFVQTDPIRFDAGDVNIYRYVFNNPLRWVDPMGLSADLILVGDWTNEYTGFSNIDPDSNVFVVGAHGNSQGVGDAYNNMIPASELANMISNHPNYTPGMDVRILACDVGSGFYGSSVAEQLGSGTVYIYSREVYVNVAGELSYQSGGSWVWDNWDWDME